MSSIKCPNCGLVNFATASACKRCKQELEAPSYPYWNADGPVKPAEPDWSKLQTVPAFPEEAMDFEIYGDGSHPIGTRLFVVYLVLNILAMFYAMNQASALGNDGSWKLLTNPKSEMYVATFEPLYYLGLSGVILGLPVALLLLLTLFRKSKAFLPLVMMFLAGEFLHGAVCTWMLFKYVAELRAKNLPQFKQAADMAESLPYLSIAGMLLTFIWFRYFTTSKRARSVFE